MTRHPRVFFAVTGASTVLADQLGKAWALARHPEPGPGRPQLFGPIRIEQVRNTGAAFGFGRSLTVWITLLALAAVAAFGYAGWRARRPAWAVTHGLLAGGALGNTIDRLARSPARCTARSWTGSSWYSTDRCSTWPTSHCAPGPCWPSS